MVPVPSDRSPPALTLATILRAALALVHPRLPVYQWKILRALCACGTPDLGGHRYCCRRCGHVHFVAHRCRNRHCPACQGAAAHDWLERQQACLLPIPYFHLVFTLPHEFNPLIQQNLRPILDLFFATVSATLLEFGRHRFGAQLGLTVVLHTWGQSLIDHYHLHVLATGGGLSADGSTWITARPYYLFPVRALSLVFRAKFCAGLQQLFAAGKLQFHGQLQPLAREPQFQSLLRQATRHRWNVYAKRPFAGPKQVLQYLSHYTHRVALSPRRLQHLDLPSQTVTFTYKDYADGERIRSMTLSLAEFLRRFALHLLPHRFVKIRHFGLLGNRQRHQRLAQARRLLEPSVATDSEPALIADRPGDSGGDSSSPLRCPRCGAAELILVEIVPAARTPLINDSS